VNHRYLYQRHPHRVTTRAADIDDSLCGSLWPGDLADRRYTLKSMYHLFSQNDPPEDSLLPPARDDQGERRYPDP